MESLKHNKLLFWYTYFSIFSIPIFIFNFSLYLFPLLISSFNARFGFKLRISNFLIASIMFFALGSLLSTLNTLTYSSIGDFNLALAVLPNYIYWCVILLFFISQKNNINYFVINKGIYFGLVSIIIYYFILQRLGFNQVPFLKTMTQNTFAFILICFSPLALNYIYSKSSWSLVILNFLFIASASLFCGSRSSGILVLFLNMVLLFFFYLKSNKKFIVLSFIPIILLFLLFFSSNQTWVIMDRINPRIYKLIFDTEWVLNRDTSYLIRKAQVEKGMQIYEKYPVFGVGLNNFQNSNIYQPLDFKGRKWIIGKKHSYNSSSHNSYINILAEGGLLLFIPFCIIIFISINRLLRKMYLSKEDTFIIALSLGFFGMIAHLYFITAITNMFAWFLIALTLAYTQSGRNM